MRDSIRAGALAVAGYLALACSSSKTEQPVQTTTEQGKSTSPSGVAADRRGTTLVRVVNALPGKMKVDIAADSRVLFTGVGYQDVTDFQELRENVTRFVVRPAGQDTVVAENKEVMGDGARYTLVALPDDKGQPQLRVLRDELVTDPGKTKLRVINAAAGMEDLKVTVQGKDTPLFDNVPLGTEAGYKDIDPMTATLVFQAKSGAPLTVEKVKLDAGRAYTIVLTGAAGKKPDAVRFDDRLVRTGSQVSLQP
jgi:uncharacterized protein DUF4397